MANTFRGGVKPLHHIHEGKPLAKDRAILPFLAKTFVIPMGMHLGAPSTPCVSKGDRVLAGQVIGTPNGFLGVPVHASVSGTVTAVEPRQLLKGHPEPCVVIESDGLDEWVELTPAGTLDTVEPADIVSAIKAAGVVGMGGAAFPAAVKLSIPEGKKAETVIINGSECEPFLTCDDGLMREEPQRIVGGLRLLMKAAGVTTGVIALEDNKPEAAAALEQAAAGVAGVSVRQLPTKYPQGGEKQLIEVVTGKQVPQKKLPLDVGALVFNVQTAAAAFDAVTLGKPLVERITTVTGAVQEPKNLRLRIGTSFHDAIEFCGGPKGELSKLISGGPMTGFACASDTVAVAKASGGILLFDEKMAREYEESACIRCGRCVQACPIHLRPYAVKFAADQADWDKAEREHVMDCIACGACAYACPASRRLTAACKLAKDALAARNRR